MSHGSLFRPVGSTLTRTLVVAAVVIPLGVVGGFAAGQRSPQVQPQNHLVAATPTPGQFVGISPVRVLDTRVPIGVVTKAKLGPGQSINIAVGGAFGIPSDATAVSINLTLVNATVPSFVTVYPTGSSQPTASSDNANPGLVDPNGGTFNLGTSGELTVFNAAGSLNVVMDVTGYFVVAEPVLTTDASTYLPGGSVTYTGSNWDGCTGIRIDLFGPGGVAITTGVSPTNGSFSSNLTAPTTAGMYLLVAQTVGSNQCHAFTPFEIVAV